MNLREFMRFHLLKTLLALIAIQIAVVAIIQNFNHKPQGVVDNAVTIESRMVKISPLVNDFDKNEDDEIALLQVFSPINGTATFKGSIVYYTPNPDFVGLDSLAYTVSDGKKESELAYIVIQVNPNLEPIANVDKAQIYAGQSILINVLDNDDDRENDSIFIKDFTQPLSGIVSLRDNKLFYTSQNSNAMVDSFYYTICDGKSNSQQASVLIQVKSKSDASYPWLSSDIGNTELPGSFTKVGNTLVMEASGKDIWANYDGFRYAYQYIQGNCEMITKIESFDGTHDWGKTGIMVRESLTGGSKMAIVCLSNKNGLTSQQRVNDNGSCDGGERDREISAPCWVKLTRTNNDFVYYYSDNGVKWEKKGEANVPMNNKVYLGFALSNHDNGALGKVVFSNYKVVAKTAQLE